MDEYDAFQLAKWEVSKVRRDKRQYFKKIAANRTQRVLEDMESLKNMLGTPYYEYTDEELQKIVSAIEEALYELKETYRKGKKFKLEGEEK